MNRKKKIALSCTLGLGFMFVPPFHRTQVNAETDDMSTVQPLSQLTK